MVLLSYCRMSGIAFSTIVLHVAPKVAISGPMGLIENVYWIELDIENRILHLDVSDGEFEKRSQNWQERF